ncbi:MAG TPA: GEVED domain-containing protein, partial [Flavobacteriales bacterium]|nr:GEVED domain-containing protein [Flavobacteriales bacterium]
MLIRTLRNIGLALLLGAVTQLSMAQPFQQGTIVPNTSDNIVVTSFKIMEDPTPTCTGTKAVRVVSPSVTNAPSIPIEQNFSLQAGNGPQSFEVRVTMLYSNPQLPVNVPSVFIDDQFCSSCTVFQPVIPVIGTNPAEYKYVITHQSGTAFSTNGERKFTLRFTRMGSPAPVLDIRFGAIMVGKSYTEVLGYYDTPSLPLYILRDPPGDASFSKLTSGSTTCFGQSHSVSTSLDENYWAKAKVGVAGEAGLFVTSEFELYFEAGTSVTATQSQTSEFEYKTCLSASSTWSTANSGTPDDVFIGSSIRYAYGMLTNVERTTCGTVTKSANFASTPVQRLSSYNLNESYIIGTTIPQLQQQIASLTPGSTPYNKAVQQLSVWQQAIALNAAIKANAPLKEVRSFNGGNTVFEYSETQTTSESRSIQYTAILEQGLSAEFGVGVGGSGVSAGGSIKMKNEYGNGETGSNESTNTMAYTLEDGDVLDNFVVEVRTDEVFGSNVFVLDSAASRTSCKYEGGFRLDQPQLWVGGTGNTTMTVTQAAIGSVVEYPLSICNGSDISRQYWLIVDNGTNTQGGGAIIQTLGGLQPGAGNGIMVTVPGGQCITTTLTLQQPNPSIVDFNNINLYLYAACEEEYEPRIRSYITISAFFGEGNIGNVCTPVTALGTSFGDFVDGVQLGSINNTGTGSSSGPAYTNYSGQFSTTLSHTGQYMVSITSGEFYENNFSVWIDYDRDGTFEADERIGSFTSSQAFQTTNIPFVVPPTASVGTTLMRVRASYMPWSDPANMDPCLAYDYGETEDYGIVINGNTPVDCSGTAGGTAHPGTACNDNNPSTGNDTWNANCQCIGIPVDCTGVPGGSNVPGTACDDGNPNTASDVYNANCQCVGQLIDCTGLAGGSALPGTACNDGIPSTGNDTWNANCQCVGLPIDCTGTPGGNALPGTACNDGNPLSTNDTYDSNCQCAGVLPLDCNGVPGGPAQPGTPCNDGNPDTGGDTYGANCLCAGLPFDCAGTPGGSL